MDKNMKASYNFERDGFRRKQRCSKGKWREETETKKDLEGFFILLHWCWKKSWTRKNHEPETKTMKVGVVVSSRNKTKSPRHPTNKRHQTSKFAGNSVFWKENIPKTKDTTEMTKTKTKKEGIGALKPRTPLIYGGSISVTCGSWYVAPPRHASKPQQQERRSSTRLSGLISRDVAILSLQYPISRDFFSRRSALQPNGAIPLWYLCSHRHICGIPDFVCNISRDNCAIPYKSKRKRVFDAIATSMARYEKYRCWALKV